jgi:ankyrin repeat protein
MKNLIIDEELYTIVRQGDPFNELDARLRSMIIVDQVLQQLYERDDQHVNLLMLAALHGHNAVIQVLLSHSSHIENFVEFVGHVTDSNGNSVGPVTALWCACDRGHYTAARILIEVGKASVYFDSGNPLLIDALTHERFDTMQFLIENNYVDIDQTHETDYPYHNSLMLCAAAGRKNMVAYLLRKGAEIDYISQRNDTALGCAAKEGHLDIVQFLCSAGASTDTKNRDGQTPLALAFENNHSHIVDYFLNLTKNELCIDELELLACTTIVRGRNIIDHQTQYEKMMKLMEKIFHLREKRNCPKIVAPPIAAYKFHQECQTIEEFEKIRHNHNRLYIEALIIRERILFPTKTIKLCDPHLVYGDKLIQQGDFEQCLHLWEHTFHLYQDMGHETSLHRFVWIFCRMILANVFISPQLFIKICRLTFEPAEQTKKNHSIKNALCFVTIAAKVNRFFSMIRS